MTSQPHDAPSTQLADLIKHSPLSRLETQVLLAHILGVNRSWLIAHDDYILSSKQLEQFQKSVAARQEGWPIAYLTGQREFGPHVFAVTPSVLIPRPETELLLETALQTLAPFDVAGGSCNHAHDGSTPSCAPDTAVLDLGTGSGIIAISIALACPSARVVASDASADALQLAQQNAKTLGAVVEFLHGHWYDALTVPIAFDLIVSNPPYIAASDPHLQQGDLRFEPLMALRSGPDGLQAIRQIIAKAPAFLKPKGALWLEHGFDQGDAVRQLLRQSGFQQITTRQDLAGIDRVTGGHL